MEQNFESLMESLNDQMTRLNQNLTDQLSQTNQNLTDQITHITVRLDRLEAHTPRENHEVQNELEPESEFETPTTLEGLFIKTTSSSQILGDPIPIESITRTLG